MVIKCGKILDIFTKFNVQFENLVIDSKLRELTKESKDPLEYEHILQAFIKNPRIE